MTIELTKTGDYSGIVENKIKMMKNKLIKILKWIMRIAFILFIIYCVYYAIGTDMRLQGIGALFSIIGLCTSLVLAVCILLLAFSFVSWVFSD